MPGLENITQWTDPSRTFLIQEIKKRPIIWEREVAPDSIQKMSKHQAFIDVSRIMSTTFPQAAPYTVDDVRTQFKNLKDTFVRKLRYKNEGKYSYDSQKEPTWKFYKMLSFLDEKKKSVEEAVSNLIAAEQPMFDLTSVQGNNGLEQVKCEVTPYDHSNHSAASSEEQMLSLFAQTYKEQTPVQGEVADYSSLPSVSQVSGTILPKIFAATPSAKTPSHKNSDFGNTGQSSGSHDEDEEPRRKRAFVKRSPAIPLPQEDEYDLFGSLIAAQLRRTAEDHSRGTSLRLQKKLSDVLYDSQMKLIASQRNSIRFTTADRTNE